jgi:uncharacterized protein (TIGR00369 family)
MQKLDEHGPCFVCGTANPRSMGITCWADDQGRVSTTVTLDLGYQGPPGYVHGGASAALLDEAMGAAVWHAGYQVVAVNLEVEYRRPLPLGEELRIWSEVVENNGRTVRARGEILLPDGTVGVIGRGIYVEAPQFFEHTMFRPAQPPV